MSTTAGEPDNTPNPKDWGLAPVAMLLAFLCLLVSGPCSVSRWPPEFYPQWGIEWVLCLGAVYVALDASRSTRTRRCRLWSGISIMVAVASSWVSIDAYYGSYHDYPWVALVGIFGLVIVGGALGRQRTLAVAATLFCGVWFYGAFVPPASNLPATVRNGDLTLGLSLPQAGADGWILDFSGARGTDLENRYDLKGVSVSGMIGWAIPVRCWPPNIVQEIDDRTGSVGFGDDVKPYNRVDMALVAFVPPWARSWDATVVVPIWPRESAAHVVIPVAKAGSRAVYSDTKGPVHLTVSDVSWTRSTNEFPPQPCLVFTVRWSGYSYSGFRGRVIRISDGDGHSVPYESPSFAGEEGGGRQLIQIDGGPARSVKTLRIDAYSESQLDRSKVVFRFARLPGR